MINTTWNQGEDLSVTLQVHRACNTFEYVGWGTMCVWWVGVGFVNDYNYIDKHTPRGVTLTANDQGRTSGEEVMGKQKR